MPRSTFASNPLTPPLGTSTPTHRVTDYRTGFGSRQDDSGMDIHITSKSPEPHIFHATRVPVREKIVMETQVVTEEFVEI